MRLESEGCTRWFFTPTSLIDEWIREDTAYTDFTTSVLGISRAPGRARLTTRERIAAYGLREAALVYEKLGAKARLLHPEGEWAEPGTALEAEGPAAALHAALEASPDDSIHGLRRRHLHAAAGRARQDSNPRIVVAMARKAPPGDTPCLLPLRLLRRRHAPPLGALRDDTRPPQSRRVPRRAREGPREAPPDDEPERGTQRSRSRDPLRTPSLQPRAAS